MDDVVDKIIGAATVAKAAPWPWRVGERGAVVDANGDPVIYVAARLDIDGSWRDVAAELAAAHEMREALATLLPLLTNYIGWRATAAGEPEETAAEEKARAALAKARGES
jgi:hypothetical protein